MLMTSCAETGSTNSTVVVDTACNWVKPILVTEADILSMDERTKRAILTHNKTWKANCANESTGEKK
ncbi:hypothetical protein JJN11_05785 [Leclercia adecarboxylata]|nr:hypothetical protein JJN11_05785 [Leclercia adecarboxylata]